MPAKKPDDMTEEELARFYEERKGDLALWQKTPRQIRRRRGGASTVFAVRLAPSELQDLQAAAKRAGTTISDFIRSAALRAASASDEPAELASLLNEAAEQTRQSAAALHATALRVEKAAARQLRPS